MKVIVSILFVLGSLSSHGQSTSTHYQSPVFGHFGHGLAKTSAHLEHVIVNSWTSGELQRSSYAINRPFTSNGAMADTMTGSIQLSGFAHQISVYPNPFSQNIEIKVQGPPIQTVRVIGPDGKVLIYAEPATQGYIMDLSSLTVGLYLLMIQQGEQWQYVKIIKYK